MINARSGLIIGILLLLVSYCYAGDTTRVFFIGNSFTYVNDAPGLIKGFTDAAALGFYYEQHTPGGVSVGDIGQDTLAHWQNPTVFNTLRAGGWNYVVLQDNQGRFIMSYGTFPPTSVSKVIEGHIKIQDSMHFYNPCANMLLFAGWGPKSGYLPYSSTGLGLIENIYANYSFLNDSMHELISPIGIAWARAMQAFPAADLWGPDSTHPSLAGSYLTAAVIFSSIFRIDPKPINFTGGLDSLTAWNFRNIAWQTVLDSAVTGGLASISIPLINTNNVLSASGSFHNYQWYRNDSAIVGLTTSSLNADSGYCYSLTALDSNECLRRSLPLCVSQSLNVQNANVVSKPIIYPNPAYDLLNISIAVEKARLVITDIAGRPVLETEITQSNTSLKLGTLCPGIYLINLYSGGFISRQRLVIASR